MDMDKDRDLTNKDREEDEELSFSSVLASSVHDMKNSLSMLLNMINELMESSEEKECRSYSLLSTLQYETKRMINSLVQLLSIYSIDYAHYSPNITYNSLCDLFDELLIQNKSLMDFKHITLEMECEKDLMWFFDAELLTGVLNNILNNSYRYTKDKLKLSARATKDFIVITLEDNGEGYPECMLGNYEKKNNSISFKTGNTGLGLFFSSLVAKMHKNQGRRGHIAIENGGTLGGGIFSIHLP